MEAVEKWWQLCVCAEGTGPVRGQEVVDAAVHTSHINAGRRGASTSADATVAVEVQLVHSNNKPNENVSRGAQVTRLSHFHKPGLNLQPTSQKSMASTVYAQTNQCSNLLPLSVSPIR